MTKPPKPPKAPKESTKRSMPVAVVPPTRPRAQIWAALFLAAAACALYASSWHYGFAGDDAFVTWRSEWTRQGLAALPHVVSHSLYFGSEPVNLGLYRPAAGAYYVVVGALVGLRPAGYHIAQILFYGLNAAIVFLFLRRLTGRSIAVPFVATLLFIVHPIHTEIVDNIKSADEMLCLTFFLTSATAWLIYADTADARWRYASLAAFAVAVCSKETAVAMVVVLPALWYFFRGRSVRASLVAAVPFLAVPLLYLGVRAVVLAREPATAIVTLRNNALLATGDHAVQFASALTYLAKYVRMLFWPHPLSFDYTYNAIPLHTFGDAEVWLAIALCAGLGAILVTGFRTRGVAAFAVLWFGASIAAVSNLLFLISTNFGERLLYLPSVVVCYVAARLLFTAARIADEQTLSSALRSPIVVVPLLVVLSAASLAAIDRTRDWRDEFTLFSADVLKYPGSARLNNYVGKLYYLAGDSLLAQHTAPETAAADFSNAKTYLLRGLGIMDDFQDMHAGLGMAEYQLKQCGEAIPHLERTLAMPAYRTAAIETMAECYKQVQMPARALELFRQIDAEGIQYPPAWFELGSDALARGDDTMAIRYFGQVLAVTPDDAHAQFSLAFAQYRKGDYVQSLASAERCIALQADQASHTSCLLVAAIDCARTGRRDQASTYFERAKAIDPNHPWIAMAKPFIR